MACVQRYKKWMCPSIPNLLDERGNVYTRAFCGKMDGNISQRIQAIEDRFPGALYHVMSRENKRNPIFEDEVIRMKKQM